MKKYAYWFGLLGLIGLVACQKPDKLPNTTRSEKYEPNRLVFNYFSAKGKMNYRNEDNKTKANIYIRMRKDSLIWFSARLAGVEGLRVLISKDSVFILDRGNKRYYTHDYTSISERLNFRVNYDMIQSLIIADLPFKNQENTKLVKRRNHFLSKQEVQGFLIENSISRFINRLTKIVVKEEEDTANQLTINYENFQKVGKLLLPYQSKANLQYFKDETKQNTSVEINFTKIELLDESLKFPFKVSSKYQKQ